MRSFPDFAERMCSYSVIFGSRLTRKCPLGTMVEDRMSRRHGKIVDRLFPFHCGE